MIIILGSTRDIEVNALRHVIGLPRYNRLTFESIATHPKIQNQPIIGHENIYRIVAERAQLAYDTKSNECRVGLGIQHGVTTFARKYFLTTIIALHFPNGEIAPHVCGTVEIDQRLVVEAHKHNESVDITIGKVHGTHVPNDPIHTITRGKTSRMIIITESLKMLFATVDWSQYIRLSSAAPA